MQIEPIAYIKTDFKEKFGIPRQSGRAPALVGRIIFEKDFGTDDAIRGLEDFSHIWLIFGFSQAQHNHNLTVRPPRLGGNTRMGVFATRSPFRPNSLGMSAIRLDKIEKDENGVNTLVVSGIDMLDKTPIYDIKPYIPYADCIKDAKGSYADEMCSHSLKVEIDDSVLSKICLDKRSAIIQCLSDDPRPSYHNDNRGYSMRFANYDIHFYVDGNTLVVTGIDECEVQR